MLSFLAWFKKISDIPPDFLKISPHGFLISNIWIWQPWYGPWARRSGALLRTKLLYHLHRTISVLRKNTDWPFCDQLKLSNNTWNYAVTQPLLNGENCSSLSCSCRKLFVIKDYRVTFGSPCIWFAHMLPVIKVHIRGGDICNLSRLNTL
jgi:hypothetical protein